MEQTSENIIIQIKNISKGVRKSDFIKKMNIMKKLFISIMMVAAMCNLSSCGSKSRQNAETCESKTYCKKYPENSPVAKHGALQVKDLQLSDKDGNPVQLTGMSTMGWQWCKECYTKESLENLVKNWNINVLRLAMYIQEGGYNTDPQGYREMMCNLIDWCGELGIYAVVDWHVLTPGNPLAPEYADAKDFFRFISTKYAGAPHVIYELCNEPNNCQKKDNPEKPWECTSEENVTWEIIAEYANKVIPVIHATADSVKAPHPVIIVGTPQWDQLVDAPLKVGRFQGNDLDLDAPLQDRDAKLQYDNIMYAFHFYARSHNEGFEKDGKANYYNMYAYIYDVLGKLPVFCSEFGTVEASGDGEPDFNRTDKWLLMFNGNNAGKQLVSYCNWSYCDKEETSAALLPGSCEKEEWNNVTPSGGYIKKVLAVMNGGVTDTTVLKPENLYTK
jgi:aryl-phospho-beta-D-glucosidase BglC (GH1 family)